MLDSLMQPGSFASTSHIFYSLFGSLFACIVIAQIYKKTHRGLSYSQSFQFSLVLLGILGAVIMIIASGSLLNAIGILGAFSLIRFRTAIKDPKDMAYIFFVLGTGMGMGAQMYLLSIVTTVFVCLVILILTALNFGMATKQETIIRVLFTPKFSDEQNVASIEGIIQKYASFLHLLRVQAQEDRMECTYGFAPKRADKTAELFAILRKKKEVEHVELFDAKNHLEF